MYQLALHQRRSGRADAQIGFGQAKGWYCELARESGIPVVDFSLRSGRDFAGLLRATRIFNEFDVHHFHAAELVLMLASMRSNALRVYTHRGGHIEYHGRRALRYRLAANVLRRFDAITGTAQATTAIPRLFGIPEHRVYRTWNGVNPELLAGNLSRVALRSEHGFGPDAVLIGTAARLREWKRVDLLIDAASALRPVSDWHVVILGDGPDRPRLTRLSQMSTASPRITFVGMQSNIGAWLSALDVFVLPSGPEESFGNAVVEAMAVGLPVIVFADSPALVEHVVDGETGFVVRTTVQLAQRLEGLIDDPPLRDRLGEAARAFARTHYSMERIVERLDEIYASAREKGSRDQRR